MIVVNTKVLAYLYLPTTFPEQAEALLDRDPHCVAPILWRSEFRSMLAGYLRRRTLIFENALALRTEADGLLAGNEYEPDSRRVPELVRDSDCSAYECEFAALAMQLGVKLVTVDDKLLKAFPGDAIALTAV